MVFAGIESLLVENLIPSSFPPSPQLIIGWLINQNVNPQNFKMTRKYNKKSGSTFADLQIWVNYLHQYVGLAVKITDQKDSCTSLIFFIDESAHLLRFWS